MATKDTLQTLADKACHHRLDTEDWGLITDFCDNVQRVPNGEIEASVIILDKVRNPNARVALLALTLLDACMKNCGKDFQHLVGKFKFLNELIKLVSNKYYANTPEPVKKRILELIQGWAIGFPDEAKINEAYQMLRRQGHEFPITAIDGAPPIATSSDFLDKDIEASKKNAFDDEDNNELLNRLLKSKNPKDHERANSMIKRMYNQESKKVEGEVKLRQDLELVNNNVRLLTDIITNYRPTDGRIEENDLATDLHRSVSLMQPRLQRLIQKINEEDARTGLTSPILAEVLTLNDNMNKAVESYEALRDGRPLPQRANEAAPASQYGVNSLADLFMDFASPAVPSTALVGFGFAPPVQQQAPPSYSQATRAQGSSLLDEQLAALGIDSAPSAPSAPSEPSLIGAPISNNVAHNVHSTGRPFVQPAYSSWGTPVATPLAQPVGMVHAPVGGMPAHMVPVVPVVPVLPSQMAPRPIAVAAPAPMPVHVPAPAPAPAPVRTSTPAAVSSGSMSLLDLDVPVMRPQAPAQQQPPQQQQPQHIPAPVSQPVQQAPPAAAAAPALPSLKDMVVPIDAIAIADRPPMTVYDSNGLSVIFHMTKNAPAPGVLVIAISYLNSRPSPMKNFVFQVAVPKTMQVKLQGASAPELPGFSITKGQQPVNQVMLIAKPASMTSLRLKFRLSYTYEDKSVTDQGDVAEITGV